MKKYLALLATLYITFFNISIPNISVSASSNETYLRVVKENVYIYSDSNFSCRLFEIPYSYYVKVESIQNNVVKATYGLEGQDYPFIIGYLKLEELEEVFTVPTNPFSTIKVSCLSSDVLFNDVGFKKAYFNVSENTFMVYYGKYVKENGNEVAYVYCNNKLGYFDKNSLNPFTVPLHKDPIETESPTADENDNKNDGANTNVSTMPAENLQVLIIIGLSIICIAIVYALFKPSKHVKDDEEIES